MEGWHVSVLPDPMLVSCSGLSILPCRRLLASCQTEDHQLSILLRKESLKPSDARSFCKQDHNFQRKQNIVELTSTDSGVLRVCAGCAVLRHLVAPQLRLRLELGSTGSTLVAIPGKQEQGWLN